jgi:hypothetical protein
MTFRVNLELRVTLTNNSGFLELGKRPRETFFLKKDKDFPETKNRVKMAGAPYSAQPRTAQVTLHARHRPISCRPATAAQEMLVTV